MLVQDEQAAARLVKTVHLDPPQAPDARRLAAHSTRCEHEESAQATKLANLRSYPEEIQVVAACAESAISSISRATGLDFGSSGL